MGTRSIGHACVEFADGDAVVLVDPFLKPNNPAAQVSVEEIQLIGGRYSPDIALVPIGGHYTMDRTTLWPPAS